MKGFYEKQEYTEDDINRIIIEKWEESLKLELKSSEALGRNNIKEISKDISAFANSDGGIIIYGIKEKDHVADGVSFVDGNTVTKEWIEQVINSSIQPKIEGLLIFPIRFDSDIRKSVYVIKIPKSDDGHMAVDKKHYKRHNFVSSPMEQYEVRNLYNRSKKTDLSIVDLKTQKRVTTGSKGNYGKIDFEIDFIVRNESSFIENNFKMEATIPGVLIYDPATTLEKFRFLIKEKDIIYSIPNQSPLFQNDEMSLCPIYVRINKRTFNDPENFVVKIKLYFSNGSENYKFDLRDYLEIDGEKINEAMFVERN